MITLNVRYLLVSSLSVLLLSGCTGIFAVPEPAPLIPGALKRSEVLELFLDKTVESVTLVQKRVSLSYYSPTGEVRQLRDGQKRFGHWRVSDKGRICLQMDDAEEKCRVIVRESDGSYQKYIIKKDGQHDASVGYRSFVSGNPDNL